MVYIAYIIKQFNRTGKTRYAIFVFPFVTHLIRRGSIYSNKNVLDINKYMQKYEKFRFLCYLPIVYRFVKMSSVGISNLLYYFFTHYNDLILLKSLKSILAHELGPKKVLKLILQIYFYSLITVLHPENSNKEVALYKYLFWLKTFENCI